MKLEVNRVDRAEIKSRAKKIIEGNLWKFWKPTLIVFGISFLLTFLCGMIAPEESPVGAILSLVVTFLLAPIEMGLTYYIMQFARGKECNTDDLWRFMKKAWPVIMLSIIVTVLVVLWSILFIIPGILAALSYVMATFVFADGEDEPMECIDQSKKMMRGHRWEYVVFCLSFLGWMLLGCITFGLGLIYVMPYYNVSLVLYYDELRKLQKTN